MMNLSAFQKSFHKTTGRSLLILKKHSPVILTSVGIGGVVTSAVMASKATLQLESKIEELQENLQKVVLAEDIEGYTEKDALRDRTIIYTRGVTSIGKLYAPAVSVGMVGIACIVGAHGIMQKRNVALVAAYSAVERSFNEYKARVVEELGEDQERDIRLGIKEEEVTGEDGKKKVVSKIDPNGLSEYARFFDELSADWSKTPEYNLMFLKCQQNYANDLLKSRGHIFLNEVYDMLGLPRSEAGQIVGWVMNNGGDNFVDFGVYDFDSQKARDFVNGYERSILLDFNVDGTVFDRI